MMSFIINYLYYFFVLQYLYIYRTIIFIKIQIDLKNILHISNKHTLLFNPTKSTILLKFQIEKN